MMCAFVGVVAYIYRSVVEYTGAGGWRGMGSVVSIRKLPDPAIMLQGPDKDKVTFSNSLSRRS